MTFAGFAELLLITWFFLLKRKIHNGNLQISPIFGRRRLFVVDHFSRQFDPGFISLQGFCQFAGLVVFGDFEGLFYIFRSKRQSFIPSRNLAGCHHLKFDQHKAGLINDFVKLLWLEFFAFFEDDFALRFFEINFGLLDAIQAPEGSFDPPASARSGHALDAQRDFFDLGITGNGQEPHCRKEQ
jgi:hypothetical protein